MKYEAPKLTALTPAISAIQDITPTKEQVTTEDAGQFNLQSGCYQDNE